MVEKTETRNAFEFVTLASARARQLLSGCTPRVVSPSAKQARTAMAEVREGNVGRAKTKDEK